MAGNLFLEEIPEAAIVLDGNRTDWTGIEAMITDAQNDSVCDDPKRAEQGQMGNL